MWILKAFTAVVLLFVCIVFGSVGGCMVANTAFSPLSLSSTPLIVGTIVGAVLGVVGGVMLASSLFRRDK